MIINQKYTGQKPYLSKIKEKQRNLLSPQTIRKLYLINLNNVSLRIPGLGNITIL